MLNNLSLPHKLLILTNNNCGILYVSIKSQNKLLTIE